MLTNFQEEFEKEYFLKLTKFLDFERYSNKIIYPSQEQIFKAFTFFPFENTKLIILGQDPYHGENQANGLAFSVNKEQKVPPSLRNIYLELSSDLNIKTPTHGDLSAWAKQGVLLLNSVLTVEKDSPGSHQHKGWEEFTDHVLYKLNTELHNLVFLLWGNYAKSKLKLLDTQKHLVLTANHPSPLSAYRGFFGCKHFSKSNEYLVKHGKNPIDWSIS